MNVRTIDGTLHEIDPADERRVYHELARKMGHEHPEHHRFLIGGSEVALTVAEMKQIADAWWERYGKGGMTKFYEDYRDNAAENIREALGCVNPPESEAEVKEAIAMSLSSGHPETAAEVIFEAMEFCNAYTALKSFGK